MSPKLSDRSALPFLLAVSLLAPNVVWADPTPTIATYELKKQRDAQRAETRDPKGFWVRQILRRIEERKYRLKEPLREAVKVEVGFVVGRDGQVKSKEVTKSSGLPAVDRVALALLDRAAPFPPMPTELTDEQLSFNLPLSFH